MHLWTVRGNVVMVVPYPLLADWELESGVVVPAVGDVGVVGVVVVGVARARVRPCVVLVNLLREVLMKLL